MHLSLREANQNDVKLFFDWATDPVVRETALNSSVINWESHVKWFTSKLNSKSLLFVLLLGDKPIGQIKFDQKKDSYFYLGYSIDSKYRGLGYGKKIVDIGINYLHKKNLHINIIAQVKKTNIASIRVFEGTPFQFKREIPIDNIPLYEYELRT